MASLILRESSVVSYVDVLQILIFVSLRMALPMLVLGSSFILLYAVLNQFRINTFEN